MDPNFIVKVGQIVNAGDVIAKIGAKWVKSPYSDTMVTNGNTTGPHLHFGLRVNGSSVDPLPYITRQKN
jgi:murein DD-endopeptidase MepM/ murein hydrolase activator NlpD